MVLYYPGRMQHLVRTAAVPHLGSCSCESLTTTGSSPRPPGSERAILYPWVIVNLSVTLMVGLAWALIATGPETDHTEGKMTMQESFFLKCCYIFT